jgi:hypothetical protein
LPAGYWVSAAQEGRGVHILHTSISDDAGSYSFNDLQPGLYRITYAAPAFRTVVQEGVTEAITVSGSAMVLQTDRAGVNFQIQQSQITNLPFTDNNDSTRLLSERRPCVIVRS